MIKNFMRPLRDLKLDLNILLVLNLCARNLDLSPPFILKEIAMEGMEL